MKIRIILMTILLSLPACLLIAQDYDKDLDKISTALKQSDHEQLHDYFRDMVEISIPGNEGTYSRVQARYIFRDFFKEYPARDFRIKHKGSSNNGAKYAIGEYSYDKGKMRTYFLLKSEGSQYLIHIIHFEKQ